MELRVIRVARCDFHYRRRLVGSSQPPKDMFVGLDWSRVRDVNGKGNRGQPSASISALRETPWEVTYTEENPNKKHKSEKLDNRFTVVGYEAVEVPAEKQSSED